MAIAWRVARVNAARISGTFSHIRTAEEVAAKERIAILHREAMEFLDYCDRKLGQELAATKKLLRGQSAKKKKR